MDQAWERRQAEQAEAEAELQSRIEMLEAPEVQGTDVYDLDDARAVIDRLRWATERIEELEERSRIADDAGPAGRRGPRPRRGRREAPSSTPAPRSPACSPSVPSTPPGRPAGSS